MIDAGAEQTAKKQVGERRAKNWANVRKQVGERRANKRRKTNGTHNDVECRCRAVNCRWAISTRISIIIKFTEGFDTRGCVMLIYGKAEAVLNGGMRRGDEGEADKDERSRTRRTVERRGRSWVQGCCGNWWGPDSSVPFENLELISKNHTGNVHVK
jgi:hypothetical protein